MGYLQNNFKHVLTVFFNTYKPKLADKVDSLVEEFEGREYELIKALCERYFVDLNKFQSKFEEKLVHEAPAKKPVTLKKIEVNDEGEEVEVEYEAEEEEELTAEEAPKKSKKMLFIIIGIVALGIGAAAFMMMGGDADHTDEVEQAIESDNSSEAIEDADIEEASAPKEAPVEKSMNEAKGDTSSNDQTNDGGVDTTTINQEKK